MPNYTVHIVSDDVSAYLIAWAMKFFSRLSRRMKTNPHIIEALNQGDLKKAEEISLWLRGKLRHADNEPKQMSKKSAWAFVADDPAVRLSQAFEQDTELKKDGLNVY